MGIAAGIFTVVLVVATAWRLGGRWAGVTAGALLAFSEYHVQVSALATEKAYYLLFVALAIWLFVRYIEDGSNAALFSAAIATGLALLCKELAWLLAPSVVLGLASGRPETFRDRKVWFAAALTLVIVLPDAVWNFSAHAHQADYRTHLARLEGIGLSPQPIAFYLYPLVARAGQWVGRPLYNTGAEYAAMNPLLGALALSAVVGLAWRARSSVAPRSLPLLLASFLVPFLFLSLIETRQVNELDRQLFIWSDLTLIPASVLAGVWAVRGGRGTRLVLVALVIGVTWSSWRVWRSLEMPRVNMVWFPEVLDAADGAMHRLDARVLPCFWCRPIVRAELLDVEAWEDDRRVDSLQLSRDVKIGEGESLSALVGAAVGAGAHAREYLSEYRLTDSRGRSFATRSSVVVLSSAGAAYWPPVTW